MREIDAEAPVVWPAWCYSANTQDSAIDVISRKGDLASDLLPATSPSSYVQPSDTTILPTSGSGQKSRTRRKNPYTISLTAATTPAAGATAGIVSYNSSAASSSSTRSVSPAIDPPKPNEKLQQHLQLSSFLINKKMLSERILMGFGSSALDNSNNNNNNLNSSNNKKNCDNPTISVYDKIKNEAQVMDPVTASSASSHLKNGDLNTANNGSSSNSSGVNNSASNIVNSSVKKERLSPTANGDVHSSLSRSRSATPSSFPGTPPQSTHPSDLTSQSILNQSRNNEFQARNYSDFMRSLAAKYNNTNPNDASSARNLFFDHQKYTSGPTKSASKESPSPPEIKRSSLATPPQVPFVPPLFPGLPFSPTVFPPLIDMSSTQALVTLARAAKEAELQNILRNAPKRPGATTSQSLSPSLRAVQQLAQFNPQSFMIPSQFQAPQRSPTGPPSRNSQSPHHYRGEPTSSSVAPAASSSNNTSSVKRSSSPPLDLSSSQQIKRQKIELSTSSPAASPPMTVIPSSAQTKDYSASTRTTIKAESPAAASSSGMEFPRHCRSQSDEISSWTVDDVGNFVSSIDICAEYAQKFRDQCIDGSGLPLLTEDHLTNSLGMKLGPALKLRSILAKKLGGPCPCVSCTTLLQQQQQQQQPPPPAIHLTPPRAASSSAISSSSSLVAPLSGSSSSLSTTVTTIPTNTNAINNNSNSTASSLTAIPTSAATITTNTSISGHPARPASADSGS